MTLFKFVRSALWPGSPKDWNFNLDWRSDTNEQGVYATSFRGMLHLTPVLGISLTFALFFGWMAVTSISSEGPRIDIIASAICFMWFGLNIVRVFGTTSIVYDSVQSTIRVLRCIGGVRILKSECSLDEVIVLHFRTQFAGIVVTAPIGATALLMPNGERVLLSAGGSLEDQAAAYSRTPFAAQKTATQVGSVVTLPKYVLL